MLIYVLCPDDTSLQEARSRYTDSRFRPILLPQTAYLEGYMYTHYLHDQRQEWLNEDYVGCIAHTAHTKQPLLPDRLDEIHAAASESGVDLIALMYRGDPLVETACRWHGENFRLAWLETWHSVGWCNDELLTNDANLVSFYCNYWATTPRLMERYCLMMRYLDDRIQVRPALKELLWRDSLYQDRGAEIARMPVETRRRLYGTDYYPLLNFVIERMPCVFFTCFATQMALVR